MIHKSIIYAVIFLSMACSSQTETTESKTSQEVALKTDSEHSNYIPLNGNPLFVADLYDLELTIEKTENNTYQLVTDIVLKNDAYFVSPHSKVASTGIVQFTIEPKCALEKIPFGITYKDGDMSVKVMPGCFITEL